MVKNERGSILKAVVIAGIVVCIFIVILLVALISISHKGISENNLLNKIENSSVVENNIIIENKIEENIIIKNDKDKIDYENEKDFEKDLNNGVDVKGKRVKFVVKDYEEDSLVGYNSHAGEHLNFISKNDLKLKSNDIVIAKVISISKFLDLWMIEIEEAEKVENIEKIKPPISSTSVWKEEYKDLEKKFKDAGFTNVTLKKIEDAKPNGIWVKAGQVKAVYIGGKSTFYLEDEFDKKSKVVIEYHTYPSVKYTKVSVKTLINALDKNAATAKEKYINKYLEISGVVRSIDADLNFITISSDLTQKDTIKCYINNKDTEKKVKKISKGDKIVVRGQISSVGEVLGYWFYITEIAK